MKHFLLLLTLVLLSIVLLPSCSSSSEGSNSDTTNDTKVMKNFRIEQNDTLITCRVTECNGYITTDSTVMVRTGATEPYLRSYHISETK